MLGKGFPGRLCKTDDEAQNLQPLSKAEEIGGKDWGQEITVFVSFYFKQ